MINTVELTKKITDYLVAQKWKNINIAEFDDGYASLTVDEKQIILNSIINGDDFAKTMIREKLNIPITAAARIQAENYVATNSIPVDVIADLF